MALEQEDSASLGTDVLTATGGFRSTTPARKGVVALGATTGVAGIDEGAAETGVVTAVDEADKGKGETGGDWREGDSRMTLWKAGDWEEFRTPDVNGALKDGDSTIMLGIRLVVALEGGEPLGMYRNVSGNSLFVAWSFGEDRSTMLVGVSAVELSPGET